MNYHTSDQYHIKLTVITNERPLINATQAGTISKIAGFAVAGFYPSIHKQYINYNTK